MKYFLRLLFFLTLIFHMLTTLAFLSNDPLPSWNNNQAKQKILEFVSNVTNQYHSEYKKPEERIAVFDNDGTLWIEKPFYTQARYAFDQIRNHASQHSQWRTEQPFKAILDNDQKVLENLSIQEIEKILAVSHVGMSVEAFQESVKKWLATAINSRFNRHYTQLVYQPMLELMNYLRANHFQVYIVSGGGQDFIRVFAQQIYNVPPQHVIGSAIKTQYTYQNGKPLLIKTNNLLLLDDKTGKPEAIHLFIGRRPLMAFGNSDGDRQMLEWTQSGSKPYYVALIHHDDQRREFAYDTQSKVGTFSNSLFAEAKKNHWNIISMKNDWKQVFPGH